MIGTGEVVVVLLVIESPVLRIGHGGGRTHVLGHGLGVVEQLDLHGMMVAVLAGVVGTVVVLVPMLVAFAADERCVVGERHDGPVLAHQRVAGSDDPRRPQHFEHIGDERGGDVALGVERGPLLLENALVQFRCDTELPRAEQNKAPTGEIVDQCVDVWWREVHWRRQPRESGVFYAPPYGTPLHAAGARRLQLGRRQTHARGGIT